MFQPACKNKRVRARARLAKKEIVTKHNGLWCLFISHIECAEGVDSNSAAAPSLRLHPSLSRHTFDRRMSRESRRPKAHRGPPPPRILRPPPPRILRPPPRRRRARRLPSERPLPLRRLRSRLRGGGAQARGAPGRIGDTRKGATPRCLFL